MAHGEATRTTPREVTEAEVAHYQEHGWAKLERFVEPELAAGLLKAAQSVMGEEPSAEADPNTSSYGTGKQGGKVVNLSYWQDYHYIARDDKVEPCYSYAFSKEIARNAQLMLGRDIPIRFGSDLVACKMPQGKAGGGPTDWHQDFSSMPVDRVGGLAFWLALNDIPPERGPMRFLSGSQREGDLGRTRTQGKGLIEYYPHLLEKYEMSPPLHLKAGDATVHSVLVGHGASENQTDEPRWAYICAYIPADALYTGAPNYNYDGIGLEVNKPIEHPRFPILYP